LRGPKLGFVNTFLTILKVEPHIVVLELWRHRFRNFPHILNFSNCSERAWCQEFKGRIVHKVDRGHYVPRIVEDSNCKCLPIDFVQHVVRTEILREYAFVFELPMLIELFVSWDSFRLCGVGGVNERGFAEESLVTSLGC